MSSILILKTNTNTKNKGYKMLDRQIVYCSLCDDYTQLCRVGFMRWSITRCSRCLIKFNGKDWFNILEFRSKKIVK